MDWDRCALGVAPSFPTRWRDAARALPLCNAVQKLAAVAVLLLGVTIIAPASADAGAPGGGRTQPITATRARIRHSRYHTSPRNLRPVLKVSHHTLTWKRIPGVSSYVLATVLHPLTTRVTAYRVVTGTKITPPSVPGQTVHYGLRANLSSSPWAKEVSVTYPPPARSSRRPAPSPSSGPMVVGLNSGAWGTAAAQDIAGSFSAIRWDTSYGESLSDYTGAGLKADILFSGPYSNGVSAIDPNSWTANALSWYQSNCPSVATCPSIEVLNEPGGTWFWGSNAMSQTNADAYDTLLQDVYTAFHNHYGANSPKILGSYDGGHDSDIQWGQELYAGHANVGNYVDGWTLHPYGSCDSTLDTGHQNLVEQAHANTGKPIYITEIGWQTNTGHCDDSTQQQQADNIYKFVTWARSTGYVNAVYYFNYRDYGSSNSNDDWWGVERWGEGNGTTDGSKKPGWYALAEAADNQPCTVCN